MLAKNLQAFLGLLFTKEGVLVTDYTDEILKASMLVHAGTVTYQPAADLLKGGKA